jgi:hypothetical protein
MLGGESRQNDVKYTRAMNERQYTTSPPTVLVERQRRPAATANGPDGRAATDAEAAGVTSAQFVVVAAGNCCCWLAIGKGSWPHTGAIAIVVVGKSRQRGKKPAWARFRARRTGTRVGPYRTRMSWTREYNQNAQGPSSHPT